MIRRPPRSTLFSLHDALPILPSPWDLDTKGSHEGVSEKSPCYAEPTRSSGTPQRSEEHTSELQSRQYLVCRLLLEKQKSAPAALYRLCPDGARHASLRPDRLS